MATIMLPIPNKESLGYEEGRIPNFGLVQCLFLKMSMVYLSKCHLSL